ncbi:hypothetical protein AC579_2111 [Pseudocercospora musae]|uniref:Uncharacterized protein n=1 Tax=Pseudocercospora musae TaxID=113226 RepID=A0A139GXX7_9PEZI|nr:hypothetical protein AC579_2111 [Pseudocercospora musae]
MSESVDAPAHALFRPSKRRKVFRKRNLGEAQEEEEAAMGNAPPKERNGNDGRDDVEESSSVSSAIRRPTAKKHGIGFGGSGSGTSAAMKEASSADHALVPRESQVSAAAKADRFVKPMGKAEVIEDKHLAAFVDSKLAELRSPKAASASKINENKGQPESDILEPFQAEGSAQLEPKAPSSNAERNKDYLTRAQRKREKALRRHPKRDENDVVRDDMIDQIFREGQVPMYDQAQSNAAAYTDDDLDHDEAAARAFKAQFLADMEMKHRRKPPPSSTTTKRAAHASTGPKLGGSRSMREKMKALEASKEQAGVRK